MDHDAVSREESGQPKKKSFKKKKVTKVQRYYTTFIWFIECEAKLGSFIIVSFTCHHNHITHPPPPKNSIYNQKDQTQNHHQTLIKFSLPICSSFSSAFDAHHRSFFPFGNPFRMISPKGTKFSPQLLAVLHDFEANLEERLRKLIPKNKHEILSLPWMTLAMQALCESHNDIKTLITELELPVHDWDEKWIDVYLDISVKLLDICIAFSSELSRLNQGHLLLQCALHNLDSSSSKQFVRACSSLDGWRQHMGSKNPRIEKCGSILDNLVGSLDLPKVKKSAKGKVLMQAIYGVKVMTVFICSVFAVAFCGSTKNLSDLNVANIYSWAPAFKSLQDLVNEEIRVRFSNGRLAVLNELDQVDSSVKELYPIIQGVVNNIETESLVKIVGELSRATEKLSQGLDLLTKEVDNFFQVVLTGRDALLSNLRSDATINDSILGGNGGSQVVN
ncbi:hypothetical protein VNO77_21000 [Canavalia gladiata]|uniref:Uncharacterized protein n=1 Tax=Canavalia gladiata TaxID=3824 RepID=A0AAN9LVC0_CANGL